MTHPEGYQPVRKRLVVLTDVSNLPHNRLGRARLRMVSTLVCMAGPRGVDEFEEVEFLSDPEIHRYYLRQIAWVAR